MSNSTQCNIRHGTDGDPRQGERPKIYVHLVVGLPLGLPLDLTHFMLATYDLLVEYEYRCAEYEYEWEYVARSAEGSR